jgi:phosphoribosylanthranilate isomerase
MTRVKVCGLRDVETAVEAAKAGADMIGLMFAESRRKVTPQECFDVVSALHELRGHDEAVTIPGPGRGEVTAASWFGAWNEAIDETLFRTRPLIVGVFADMTVEEVNNIADAAHLDMVQLSGGEDEDFVDAIERPVLKAIHVGAGMTDVDVQDRAVAGHARAILLDTASAHARGGTGETFDWEVARDVARRLPLMLAGGLTPANVGDAVATVRPWAVDVSSGVETDGAKDLAKVKAFVAAVKEADRGN